MTPEQMRELADLISREIGVASWAWIVILLIGSIFGAYFGSYLRKRAENLAMRDDVETILLQLRKTTEATEEIKQQISGDAWVVQRHWSSKEKYLIDLLSALSTIEFLMKHVVECIKIAATPEGARIMNSEEMLVQRRKDMSILREEIYKLLPAYGAAQIYLSSSMFESIERILKSALLGSWDSVQDAMKDAEFWIRDVGDVRREVLAAARFELGVKPSPV